MSTPHPKPQNKTTKKSARPAGEAPAPAPNTPHASFIEGDRANAHEHGEHPPTPHEDELLGTSGSHTPAPDSRAEEPFGELSPGSTAEG